MSCAGRCMHADTISHGSGLPLTRQRCTRRSRPDVPGGEVGQRRSVADCVTRRANPRSPATAYRPGPDIPLSSRVLFSVTEDIDEQAPDLVQGTLDLLILKILALEPMHGWAISQRLRQVSRGALSGQRRIAVPRAAQAGARGLGSSRVADEWRRTPRARRLSTPTTRFGRHASLSEVSSRPGNACRDTWPLRWVEDLPSRSRCEA
jgi:PadR family transcriptional regulator, regulatory protein PadR